MAQTSWPFETVDTTETQFSQWARHIGEGVNGVPASTYLEPYADSTGMQVKVKAGQAIVRGHYYSSTATEGLAIATADATNPRIDAIVLELNPTANTITSKIVTGTPASSPVLPTLTQTDSGIYQLLLGSVLVTAADTGISADQVTDSRNFVGYRFGIWTTATRPASPALGQAGLNTTLGYPEYWDGSDWTSMVILSVDSTLINHPITDITGTTHTLVSGNQGQLLRFTNASASTLTIDDVLTVGQRVDILMDGAGSLSFVAGSGVTLAGDGLSGGSITLTVRYTAATLLCVASGQYRLVGNIVGA